MPITPRRSVKATAFADSNVVEWTIWGALGLWVLSVLAILILPNVAFIVYALIARVPLPEWPNLVKDPNAIAIAVATTLPAHLLTIGATWALVTRGGKQSFWQNIRWNLNRSFNLGLLLAACLLTTIAMLFVGAAIVAAFGTQENELQRVLKSSPAAVYLVAFLATATAPFVEETVYRGVLFPVFKRSAGTSRAIIAVTLLFALVHVPQYVEFDKLGSLSNYSVIAVILLLSLLLTGIRAWTNSLLPCFIIHTLFNGIQSIGLIVEAVTPNAQAPDVAPPSVIVPFLF